MTGSIYRTIFVGLAVVLLAVVVSVNCLQGTIFPTGFQCRYSFTSADLVVKALATVALLVFLGLLLGPVAATLLPPSRRKQPNPADTQ